MNCATNKGVLVLIFTISSFFARSMHTAEFFEETVNVRSGQTFEINLPANRTTGYSWFMGPFEAQALQFLSTTYNVEKIPGAIGLVGQGGIRTFTFKAIATPTYSDKATAYLQFLYVSPGRAPTIAKIQTYKIMINK